MAKGILISLITPSLPLFDKQLAPPPSDVQFTHIPTGHAITWAVRALLKLMGSSFELLTESQLIVIQSDLCQTLAVVEDQILMMQSGKFATGVLGTLTANSYFIAKSKVVIDLSDWEDESDEDTNGDRNGLDCKCSICLGSMATV